ncbi:MAG: hypothetical protein AB2813_02320, partial [Candidatus Sedimenticola endophacoides]
VRTDLHIFPGKQVLLFNGRHGVFLKIYSRRSYMISWRPPFVSPPAAPDIGCGVEFPTAAQLCALTRLFFIPAWGKDYFSLRIIIRGSRGWRQRKCLI